MLLSNKDKRGEKNLLKERVEEASSKIIILEKDMIALSKLKVLNSK